MVYHYLFRHVMSRYIQVHVSWQAKWLLAHRLLDKTPVVTTDSAKRHRCTIVIRRTPCLLKQTQL